MSITSFEAAKKVCNLSDWKTTNLRLQKILYLSHMIYIGRNNEPLINENEPFEAWAYGPVLPKLYHEVKIFGNDPIQDIFYWPDSPDNNETKFLEEACKHFLNNNSSKLVAMTHRPKGAWAKSYNPNYNQIISNEKILKEYQERFS